MSEAHPLMALILGSNSFVGQAEEIENQILQLPDQLNFTVGDAAILAAANTPLERDFAVVRCLDASEHAEEFPDWEDRMLNSFVLCEHFSKQDPELTVGWFNRLKLLKMPKYRYREARRWLKNGFPEDIPDWVGKIHEKYTDQLAAHAPERVPRMARCPACKSRRVHIKIERTIVYEARAGIISKDGKDVYISAEDPNETGSHIVKLICQDCGSSAIITDDDEWDLPGITT